MTITFTIRCPESRSNARKHWRDQHEDDKAAQTLVWAALASTGQIVTPHDRLLLATTKPKKIVRFTRYFGGTVKQMDFGNYVASCKPVLDALKLQREALIYDDSPLYCTEIYEPQVKNKSRAGQLEVEIT